MLNLWSGCPTNPGNPSLPPERAMVRLFMICVLILAGLGAARRARTYVSYDRAAEAALIEAAIASDKTTPQTRARLMALRATMAAKEDDFFAHHNATVKALALLGTYRIRLEHEEAEAA
jgi:hypothetical protein